MSQANQTANNQALKKKSIKINTALNTLRMTLTILVPLLTYPYITRIFSSDGIGQYEWVKSVVSILTLIASMGINTYAIREGTKVRNDRKEFTQFAQELFVLNLIATAICYLLLFGLILTVPKFTLYRTYLLIYSVNIGLSALSLDWVYSVYEDYLYITVRQIIVQCVSVAGLFLLVHNRNDLIIYIIITTVSNSGANIFNFVRARKYVDFVPVGRYRLMLHLVPVIIFFGTRFAMNAYNSLDTFILGMLSTDDAVGYYNVAVKINTILVTFFMAMSPVYLPRMTDYLNKGNPGMYRSLLAKAIKLKTILIYPIVCGLFMFAPQVIWMIAGKAFDNAVGTLRILCFVLAFVLLSSIVQKDIMIPNGKEKTVLNLTLFAAISNVLISCLLIVLIDYNGAAWGSLLAEGVTFLIGCVILKKDGYDLFRMIPQCSVKYFIATLLMGLSCLLSGMLLPSNWLIICVGIPVAVVVYFGSIFLLCDEFFCENAVALTGKIKGRLSGGSKR